MNDLQQDNDPFLQPLLPEPAPAASLQYRTIRSKKTQQPPKERFRNPFSGCYVSTCKTRNCSKPAHVRVGKAAILDATILKKLSTRSWTRVDLPHGLIPIPYFSDPVVDDEEFKNLFHQYISFDMPRIVALMSPPSSTLSPEENTKARQQGIAHLGLLEPVYFMLFVSMAHILELVRRESLQPDKVSARIYARLMTVLREKLHNYKPSEAANLVLCILALSSFDMSLGNYAAVESHHLALKQLVSHAGLPYIGRSLVYVVSWDRLMAAFTGKASLYAKMPDRGLLRPPKHPKQYGMGLELAKYDLCLDSDVENLCFDICRAIEIANAENWTFRPKRLQKPWNASEIQYLYFVRDVIQNTCIILQVRDLHNSDRSRPIVFAAMIVQYLVLGKNDLPWYSTAAADRLYQTLANQDLEKVWGDNEEVLCWLMCLMIIVRPWRQRASALKLFSEWVEKIVVSDGTQISQKTWDCSCNPQDYMWFSPEFDELLDVALRDYQSSNTSVMLVDRYDPLAPGSKVKVVSCSTYQPSETSMDFSDTESTDQQRSLLEDGLVRPKDLQLDTIAT